MYLFLLGSVLRGSRLLRAVELLKIFAEILVEVKICCTQGDSCADGSPNASEHRYGLGALAGARGGSKPGFYPLIWKIKWRKVKTIFQMLHQIKIIFLKSYYFNAEEGCSNIKF
jgi:hypothetical protein